MMMTFRRILSGGAKNFYRGGAVSFATVLIMTVTLGIIGMLIFLSAILSNTLLAIQDKVDVNVYFVTTAEEDQITTVKEKLEKLPEVKEVTYTSREQALVDFRERHATDQLTLQALDELGDNPLGASLSIKAKNPSEYEGIVKFLSDEPTLSPDGSSIIDRINYYQNKNVIDRLTAALRTTEQAGLLIVLLFVLASVVIVLASMRLAIYTARDEIAVMRLVGASNMYIRGPFIVAAMLSGLISAIITLLIFYPAAWYAGGALKNWLGGFDLFGYYLAQFPMIFLTIVVSGVLLGGVSSYFAVRRYLKV